MAKVRVIPLAISTLTLANTSYTIYTLSGTGVKAKIKKISFFSATGGQLKIGTGDFTQVIPSITMIANIGDVVEEGQVVSPNFDVNIVAQSTVAGATVLVEVEETR